MIIAVYSAKGGVGKTTLAVNLGWASATISCRRTLLWDLDAQGGASFILRQPPTGRMLRAQIIDNQDVMPLIRQSEYERLDVLAADPSLADLDRRFHDLGKQRRLAKVAAKLVPRYERVIIDCPPGLTDTSKQILQAADLVIIPVIPSMLSQRAFDAVKDFLQHKKSPKVVLAPVFSMVDRRRALHRRELEQYPAWPVIPLASAYERVSEERAPIGLFMPRSSAAVQAVAMLWQRVETVLTTGA